MPHAANGPFCFLTALRPFAELLRPLQGAAPAADELCGGLCRAAPRISPAGLPPGGVPPAAAPGLGHTAQPRRAAPCHAARRPGRRGGHGGPPPFDPAGRGQDILHGSEPAQQWAHTIVTTLPVLAPLSLPHCVSFQSLPLPQTILHSYRLRCVISAAAAHPAGLPVSCPVTSLTPLCPAAIEARAG